jgi:hypothetical protein
MKKIIDDKWEITLPYTCDNSPSGTGNGSDTRIPNPEKISVTFNDKPSTVEAWIADWNKRIESSAKESREGFYKFFEPMNTDNVNELGFKLRKPLEEMSPDEKAEVRSILKFFIKDFDYHIAIVDAIMEATSTDKTDRRN